MLANRRLPLHQLSPALLVAGLAWAPAAQAAPLTTAHGPQAARVVIEVRAASAMSRCLATWDPTSQMSKREWRQTCRRVVKTNPSLYNKPF